MNISLSIQTAGRIAIAGAAAMLLGGCFLSPGKFHAELDLRQDGRFSFQYTGQIYIMALSDFADMAEAAGGKEFEARCIDEDTYEERECTAQEATEQRAEWDEAQAREARENDAMKAMMGGIDPADPEAAEELAQHLARQHGWRKVSYSGDGMFEVDFAITSRIDHDFSFPVIEQMPFANFFVVATRRQDGAVRIDAPGFAQNGGSNPMQGMLMGMPGSGIQADGNVPKVPEIEGIFRILTDAEILANNTDEGPSAVASGNQLTWVINKRTSAAPMALLRLAD